MALPKEHPDGDLTGDGPALVTVTPAEPAMVGEELASYHARFAPLSTNGSSLSAGLRLASRAVDSYEEEVFQDMKFRKVVPVQSQSTVPVLSYLLIDPPVGR